MQIISETDPQPSSEIKIIRSRIVKISQPDALLGLLHEHGLGGGVEAGILLPVVRLSLRDVLEVA